jgi:predicted nucleotidyltransferase
VVKKPTELADVIERYRRELEASGITSQRILLFGSYAKGTPHEGSDIDLIVVSPDWAPLCERERLEVLGAAAGRIMEPIQAQGFTPEEIRTGDLSTFWEYIIEKEAVPAA